MSIVGGAIAVSSHRSDGNETPPRLRQCSQGVLYLGEPDAARF
ncbi:hypothetical protein Q4543_23135 [Salipiger sp. 1_MG-2023]|nr:hypothetical protein [Salipiger sp. 1_MG-2023]MDO6588388.1 hypothetical protein [Salipiger sp. 1_MG-2023]